MILEAIVGTIVGFVSSVLLAILPAADSADTTFDVTGVIHLYSWLNTWAPLDETLQLIGLTIGVLGILGTVWAATWVLRKFHIIG